MLITRKSRFTGKTATLDVPCTQEQLDKWMQGVSIQDAMPNVSADLREFVLTGCTPEEWAAIFGGPEK